MPSPNETHTRKQLIDPALATAGWNVANPQQVGIEIPVDGFDADKWGETVQQLALKEVGAVYEAGEQFPSGISDYVLYQDNGEILAVVEAKRTSVHPHLAKIQTRFYVEEIEQRQSFRPFARLHQDKWH